MDRADIIRGPAIVTYGGTTFWSKGDVSLDIETETLAIESSRHGQVDERLIDALVRVKFVPAGEWEGLTVLWPHGSRIIGASLLAGTDAALVVHGTDGRRITVPNAFVSQMPNLVLSAGATAIEEVTFTGLRMNDTGWDTDGSLLEEDTAAFTDTSFAPANVKVVPYTAAWGASAPWDDIETETGWRIEFDMGVNYRKLDRTGTIDAELTSLAVMARAIVVAPTPAEVIAAMGIQGASAVRGRSLNAIANNRDLVITGAGSGSPLITVRDAALKQGGFRWGAQVLRVGETTWVATRQFTAGAPDPLFAIATTG